MAKRSRWQCGCWSAALLGLLAASHAGDAQSAKPAAAAVVAHPGYDLAMLATGCWFGGMWSDAEGIAPYQFKETDDKRCEAVVQQIYGREDRARWLQLRGFEKTTLDDLYAKVDRLAVGNPQDAPYRVQLGNMLRVIATAQKEAATARRAADRVKQAIEKGRPPEILAQDITKADTALQTNQGMQALWEMQAGPYTHDARAIAAMLAMGRMEMARGLPKHLKVYAVAGGFALLFGVVSPHVSTDPKEPLEGGQWLSYLMTTAAAAKHPVPASVQALQEKESLAWCGVLQGMADKLTVEDGQLSAAATPAFRLVLTSIRQRILDQCESKP